MRKSVFAPAAACALACGVSMPAWAAPGLGGEIYGATVEKGETEIEASFDTLSGGPESGEDVMKFEVARGVTDNLRLGIQAEFEQEAGGSRKAEELGVEAIYHLGRAGGVNFALYGEYAIGLNGHHDVAEAKLLMQRRTGPWDLRLNLIGEKELGSGDKVELSYAASADIKVSDRLRLGAEAFGDLGTFDHFAPAAEHVAGPYAKIRLIQIADSDGDGDDHGGLTLKAGYLFALGQTRDNFDGQFRMRLEFEF